MARAAMELIYFKRVDKSVPSVKASPAHCEPRWQRNARRRLRYREHDLWMVHAGALDERAEEATEIANSNRHRAYGLDSFGCS